MERLLPGREETTQISEMEMSDVMEPVELQDFGTFNKGRGNTKKREVYEEEDAGTRTSRVDCAHQ